MRMPTSKSGGAKFRGPTSSHAYNENEDQKYLDMIELYKQSNDNKTELKEAYEIILNEHIALNDYVDMLENRLLSLEGKLDSLGDQAWYNGKFSKTSFVDQMTTKYPNPIQEDSSTSPRCEVDHQYRYVTLPMVHKIPKTHAIGKDGKAVIPSDLQINVSRTNTEGTVIENDVLHAFNGNNNSYWKREVSYPMAAAPAKEDAIIEISLPLKLVNNLNINTIQVHPHPERGVEITNIELHYNNSWEQVKGFEQEDTAAVNSKIYSPRRRWHFPNKPVQKIRVTLTQKKAIDVEGQKVFVLGAQEIGIHLSVFEPSGGFVLSPFDMSTVGMYNIENIDHVFLNRKAFSYDVNLDNMLENNIFDYEILVDQGGMLVPLENDEWENQTAKTLWVKTQLYADPEPSNGVNPCLHAVRVNYSKA